MVVVFENSATLREIDFLLTEIDDAPVLSQIIYAKEANLSAAAGGVEVIGVEHQLRRMDRYSANFEAGRCRHLRNCLRAGDIDRPDPAIKTPRFDCRRESTVHPAQESSMSP